MKQVLLMSGLWLSSLVAAQAAEKVVLFDGKSLDAWRGYKNEAIGAAWVVEDGALHLSKGGGGDIISKAEFEDFELELEWKVAPGANSGVMYRVRLGDGAPYFSGPEYQILDDAKHADGKNPKTSAGSLYALVAADGKELKPVGEWNTTKIVIKGNQLEHWLNGKKVVDIEIGGESWNKLVEGSKFKSWTQFGKSPKGHICLQDHGDKVWYRNIRVTKLK